MVRRRQNKHGNGEEVNLLNAGPVNQSPDEQTEYAGDHHPDTIDETQLGGSGTQSHNINGEVRIDKPMQKHMCV